VELRGVGFVVEPLDRGQREFWDKYNDGRWEQSTLAIIDRCVDRNTVMVDIGAWIGPTALYAATRARRVIALEPDPLALRQLRRNIALNPDLAVRIMTIGRAVHRRAGTVTLGSAKDGGDSKSSVLIERMATSWEVETITPMELTDALIGETKIFIKMDIEGGEYALVPMMGQLIERADSGVLISLHPRMVLGETSGIERLRRRWAVMDMTNRLFGAFTHHHIQEVWGATAQRRPDVEWLARYKLCYRMLTGSWLFTPK
jgi:FkbM family methyltransferase